MSETGPFAWCRAMAPLGHCAWGEWCEWRHVLHRNGSVMY